MAKKEKKEPQQATEEKPVSDTAAAGTSGAPAENAPDPAACDAAAALEKAQAEKVQEHEQYLRLAAEFDNFRKRTQREKDGIYQDAVADTVKKFLPVYDNLERALKNETADEAYKKGVEMTMTELKKIMQTAGLTAFGAVGEPFDPQKHNAVMHTEDEALGENEIAEVFQTGFAMGEKIIRFAMVKVAN